MKQTGTAAGWALVALVGCGTSAAPAADSGAGAVDSGAGAVDSGGGVPATPQRIALSADPNGLWWEADTQTLLIADDDGNRVLAWRDDGQGTRLFATLPPGPPDGPGLGQLVRTADGTVVVTRFGHGTAGDVVYARGSGEVGRVSSLDPTRRRIGLGLADDGTLYTAWFMRQSSGRSGAVSRLSLTGSETEVLAGLTKPVGVLARGDELVVSDQERNEVLAFRRLDATPQPRRLAMITGPDLLCAGPDGSVFVGSTQGVVYRIDAGGALSTVRAGLSSTRGLAYDAAGRRLFIAEHDTDATDGLNHALHIVPVAP